MSDPEDGFRKVPGWGKQESESSVINSKHGWNKFYVFGSINLTGSNRWLLIQNQENISSSKYFYRIKFSTNPSHNQIWEEEVPTSTRFSGKFDRIISDKRKDDWHKEINIVNIIGSLLKMNHLCLGSLTHNPGIYCWWSQETWEH